MIVSLLPTSEPVRLRAWVPCVPGGYEGVPESESGRVTTRLIVCMHGCSHRQSTHAHILTPSFTPDPSLTVPQPMYYRLLLLGCSATGPKSRVLGFGVPVHANENDQADPGCCQYRHVEASLAALLRDQASLHVRSGDTYIFVTTNSLLRCAVGNMPQNRCSSAAAKVSRMFSLFSCSASGCLVVLYTLSAHRTRHSVYRFRGGTGKGIASRHA
jgi:hypothetical protein